MASLSVLFPWLIFVVISACCGIYVERPGYTGHRSTRLRFSATLSPKDEFKRSFSKPKPKVACGKPHSGTIEELRPSHACWQVRLMKNGVFVCEGTVIGKKSILTAARCIPDTTPSNSMTAVIGVSSDARSRSPRDSVQDRECPMEIPVVATVANSRYQFKTGESDIALLTLERPVDFELCGTCPICLSSAIPKLEETCAKISHIKGQNSYQAHVALLSILKTEFHGQCSIRKDPLTAPNLNNFLCAGKHERQTLCHEKNGGSVVCLEKISGRLYQAGISSAGESCSQETSNPYTRISSYIGWIKANAGDDELFLMD